MKVNRVLYDASMVDRFVLGAIDDDIKRSFCKRCPELKYDRSKDKDICPVSFKMTEERCPRSKDYAEIVRHANAIKDILSR